MTYRTEAPLLNEVLARLSRAGFLVWVNRTGKARSLHNPRALIAFGLPGSSDILGVAPGGIFVAIEIKTKNDRQSKAQKNFEAAVTKRGGLYAIVRHPDEVGSIVARALQWRGPDAATMVPPQPDREP